MDDATADKLYRFIYQSLDHDNAKDLETFGQNFLQNGKVWDMLADHFPDAKPSELRGIMSKAFQNWSKDHENCGGEHGHTHH